MTLDGGTIVGALALAFTIIVEIGRRRAANRSTAQQTSARDTSSALESWDELVNRHQHDYERLGADYEKKREQHHRCRSTVRAWELWAQQVNRRVDLDPELLAQYENLMKGDGGS